MRYQIYCLQRGQHFASEDTFFNSLEDCEEQLKSYHEIDVEGIDRMSLNEICEAFGWEIEEVE